MGDVYECIRALTLWNLYTDPNERTIEVGERLKVERVCQKGEIIILQNISGPLRYEKLNIVQIEVYFRKEGEKE